MADYSGIVSKSLKFSIHPKRWLPFFISYAVFGSLAVTIILSSLTSMGTLASAAAMAQPTNTVDPAIVMGILGVIASMASCAIGFSLVSIWLQGAIVQQSWDEKPGVMSSLRYSLKRYPSMIVASIILFFTNAIVGLIPYIGTVISFAVSIAFMFFVQFIIVEKKGFGESMGESYNIVRREPLKVFLAWLLVSLVAVLLIIPFIIPGALVALSILAPILANSVSAENLAMVLLAFNQNIAALCISALVLAVGISIAIVFGQKAITEFYRAWRGKKSF
jgi:hypothetical protein